MKSLAVCHSPAYQMASDAEVAVFIDTNLGTHLAMAVSPDITVADFQGELERIHYSCFRELGEIKVNALMVKRRSHFYHLTSSMPIKYAFCHQERGWFLHIQARTLKASDWSCLSNFAATEVEDLKCDGNQRTNPLVQNIGQEAMISSDATEWNSCLINKNPSNISSTAISAAGTINRYLLNDSGVSKLTSSPSTGKASQGLPEQQLRTKADNYYSSIQIGASPPFMVRTPSKQSSFLSPAGRTTGIPKDKVICSEVGKRIIVASNKIRISDKQRLITPLSKMRDRKLSCYKNLSRAKFLVFEICDSDD